MPGPWVNRAGRRGQGRTWETQRRWVGHERGMPRPGARQMHLGQEPHWFLQCSKSFWVWMGEGQKCWAEILKIRVCWIFFFFANVLSEKGRWRCSHIFRQMLAYYFILFLKTFFFWCGSLLKFLLSLLQYCFCFMFWCFWALGLWDLSLLTKDRTWPLCIGRWCRNCWNTREAPHLLFWLIHNLLVSRYCPHFTDEGQRG